MAKPQTASRKAAQDDPEQSQRFRELAKELGANGNAKALDGSVRRLAARAPEPRRQLGKSKPKK